MAVRCMRVKLKDDSIEHVKTWFSDLNNRKDEVLECLRNENIVVESAFLDKINETYFLVYYIKSENINHALEVFKLSLLPIDHFYKENWNKFCGEIVVLDQLLDVDLLT
jgi:Family of unknown function (DUF6176)